METRNYREGDTVYYSNSGGSEKFTKYPLTRYKVIYISEDEIVTVEALDKTPFIDIGDQYNFYSYKLKRAFDINNVVSNLSILERRIENGKL